MDTKEFPIIKAGLFISWGSDYDSINEAITKQLAIEPNETRSKGYCPVEEFNLNYWGIEERAVNCKAISYQTDKIIMRFHGKEATINRLVKEYNLSVSISIIVHAESGDGPEIVLTKSFVQFAASIDAEVGFDMYYYEAEDA